MIKYIIYMIPRLQGLFTYLSPGSRGSKWLTNTTQVWAAEMGGLGLLTIWVLLAVPGWIDSVLAALLILLLVIRSLQIHLQTEGLQF